MSVPFLRPRSARARRHSLRSVVELSGYGASYRMLDYWATNGRIDIGPKPGTGNWRVLSTAEVCAILDVIAENKRLAAEHERMTSGAYFRERLAFHVEHPSDPFPDEESPQGWLDLRGQGKPA